jgi:hypothetical protein
MEPEEPEEAGGAKRGEPPGHITSPIARLPGVMGPALPVTRWS